MNENKVTAEEVFECIEKALELQPKSINISSIKAELPEWDSFGHLGILAALDLKFNGKVASIDDMASADTVEKIISLLKANKLI
ncbi:hypothetical protein [Polynucleobacter necessarius]|uniref:hypothetical protein n=1 Tax=Polynucleobacter necessarius TaxID=576610 RepID=UPI000E099473|nr:hypothetical protein [Polynucleobacter necessarius]